VAAAGLAGLVASGAMVWKASEAAFTDTTANGSNSWTAGTVDLSNETASVMFNVGTLKPGSTGDKCMVVTYNGNLAASVKLYASAYGGTLAPYVNLTVEMGTGGNYASCTGFSVASTPYTGTLSNFGSTKNSFANGVGSWSPTGSGQTKVYHFTYTLDAATPDAQQGASATATFTWEAQNT
jgi:hypothetical protein